MTYNSYRPTFKTLHNYPPGISSPLPKVTIRPSLWRTVRHWRSGSVINICPSKRPYFKYLWIYTN